MTPRLGAQALTTLRGSSVQLPAYDVAAVVPSVVHIGPGVFHRAHQAVYADGVLATGAAAGSICAVSLRSPALRNSLRAQDHLYTVVERGDRTRVRVIGSIRRALIAPDEPEEVLQALSDASIQVVTITVTEKGYCTVAATGELDLAREEIAHDVVAPTRPQSMPGLLVEALDRRRAAGTAPFAVVSCDNIADNGAATSRVVTGLADVRGGDLAAWISGNVAFPSSMVDGMVPASTPATAVLVRALTGYDDAAAVVTEPFSQWVLEDAFTGARPPWERAGVQLVTDVAPFEQAKLRILNGAHSAFAYLGLLAGFHDIAGAARDETLARFVGELLAIEVIPTLAAPAGLDLAAYAVQVVERFGNRDLGYTTAKVAADGSQKLPIRILATVRDRIAAGASFDRLATVTAAYIACIAGPRCREFAVADPSLDGPAPAERRPEQDAEIAVAQVLSRASIFGELGHDRHFRAVVAERATSLWQTDPRAVFYDVEVT